MSDVCKECLTSQERDILFSEIHNVKDEILGINWYIVDPVGGCQGCEIILHEVVKKYKRLEERAFMYKRLSKYLGWALALICTGYVVHQMII